MLVKTLFPHNNNFGAAFTKAEGDEYDLPDDVAATLVEVGLVEAVATAPDDEPAIIPLAQNRKGALVEDEVGLIEALAEEGETAEQGDGAAGQG